MVHRLASASSIAAPRNEKSLVNRAPVILSIGNRTIGAQLTTETSKPVRMKA